MPLAIRLALRNLRRYARRSIITGITLAGGFFLMVITIGFSEGSYRQVVDSAARSGTGHVVVRPSDYDPLEPTPLEDPAAVMEAASTVERATAAPRVEGLVLATSSGGAHTVLAMGVDPKLEPTVSIFPETLAEGEWLPDTMGRVPRVLVGAGVARRLDLATGDRLVLMGQVEGELESMLTRVHGVVRIGSEQVDDNLVLLHIDGLRRLLKSPKAVHQVAVVLDDLQRSDAVQAALAEALPGTDVLTWSEALPEVGDLIAMDRASATWMFLVLFGIVGLAVLNAVLMSVLERIKEFGVLLAIGTRPFTLFAVVTLEAFFLSVLSVAAGGLAGFGLVRWLGIRGVDFLALSGMEEMEGMDIAGYSISGLIYPYLPFQRTFEAVVLIVTITVASSVYAAWRAARIAPVEAMRHA